MNTKKFLATLLVSFIYGTMAMAQSPQIQVNLFDRPLDKIIYSNAINEIVLELNGIEEDQVELTIDGGGLIKTDKLHYAVIINQGITHPKLNVYIKSNEKRNLYKSLELISMPLPMPLIYLGGRMFAPNNSNTISRGELITSSSVFSLYSPELNHTPQKITITNMTITILKGNHSFDFKSLNGEIPSDAIRLFDEIKSGDRVALDVTVESAGVKWQLKDCIYKVN